MTALLLAWLAGLAAQAPAPAAAAAPRFERPIATASAGPQRLAIDAALLAGGAPFTIVRRGSGEPVFVAENGLSDLRLFDARGREVPHLLVYPPFAEARWVAATLQPLARTDKTSGFEADFGSALDITAIEIGGLPASFMKRFRLEASGDREHWTMVVSEGTVFGMPEQQLRETTVRFAAGRYRYVRLTWDDTHSGRVPPPVRVSARLVTTSDAAPPTLVPLQVERRPSEPGRSRYHLTLPGAHLPIVALHLDAGGPYVFRRASVTEARLSSGRAEPVSIGEALLVRDQRSGTGEPSLRIAVQPPAQAELDLLVEDEGNPPLDVRGVSAELALLPWIYFEASGAVVARYGDGTLTRPVYDLEAARESIQLDEVPEARWAAAAGRVIAPAAPDVSVDVARTGAPLDASGFRFARTIADSSADLLALPLDAAVLAHSVGPGRGFADLRIVDASDRQVPWLLERRPEPLPIDLQAVRVTPDAEDLKPRAGANQSVYRVTLPYAPLADARLVLGTNARVFRRSVRLGVERPADRRHRDPWFEPAGRPQWWEHTDQSSAAPMLALSLPIRDARDVTVVVDEADNSALPLTSVQLLLPSYRLRFFRPASTARLVYGRDDLAPATYDLALLAPRVLGAAATDVTMAPEQAMADATGARLISPRLFWVILVIAVAVLLGLLAALLRQ
jgi:hypothetical protein